MKYRNNSQIQKVLMFLLTAFFVGSTLFGALFIGQNSAKALSADYTLVGTSKPGDVRYYGDYQINNVVLKTMHRLAQNADSGKDTNCAASLSWSEPEKLKGQNNKYDVEVVDNESKSAIENMFTTDGAIFKKNGITQTNIDIPKLRCGGQYTFSINVQGGMNANGASGAELKDYRISSDINPSDYPVKINSIEAKVNNKVCTAKISWDTQTSWTNVYYILQVGQVGPEQAGADGYASPKLTPSENTKEVKLACEKTYAAVINLYVGGQRINNDKTRFTLPKSTVTDNNDYKPVSTSETGTEDLNNLPTIVTTADPTSINEDAGGDGICQGGWLAKLGGVGSAINAIVNPVGMVTCLVLEGVKQFGVWVNTAILGLATTNISDRVMQGGDLWEAIQIPYQIASGIAFGFVALILVILAIVNIAHIQYDTYQIKKSLPLLITGVVLAAFSMVIVRMLLSAADSVTGSFVGNPQLMIENVLSGLGIKGLQDLAQNEAIGVLMWINPGVMSLGILAVGIVLMLISIIAVLVLVFILYIRIAMIVILTITAPLAFIALAFPLTQGLFKTWWGEAIKWVFLQSILFFILWAASMIGGMNVSSGSGAIAIWMITIALVFFAFTVPFKLGGAIMAGWGGILSAVSGTGKGGWARKPAEEWAGKTFETMKGDAAKKWRGTKWGNSMAINNAKIEELLKTQALEKEADEAKAKQQMGKRGDLLAVRKSRATNAIRDWQSKEAEDLNKIEQGEKLDHLTNADYAELSRDGDYKWDTYRDMFGTKRKGWVQTPTAKNAMDVAKQNFISANRLNTATNALSKRRDIDINLGAISTLKDHNAVAGQMEKDLKDNTTEQNIIIGKDGEGKNITKTVRILNTGVAKDKFGIDIQEFDSYGEEMKDEKGISIRNNVTYADLANRIAEAEAKAKGASTDAERIKFENIAKQYQRQASSFKSDNSSSYNYDAILDRNTYGRRLKEINPRIMEEADVTYSSTTGQSIISEMNDGVGTSEYRATGQDINEAIKGNWANLEDTSSFAVMQHFQAVQKYMVQAAQGNVEGMTAMHGFVNKIQSVRGGDYKKTLVTKSLNTMSEKQKTNFNATIHEQYKANGGTAVDYASMSATEREATLSNINMEQLSVDNTEQGQANKAFLQRVAFNVHDDKELGLKGSPGSPVGRVNPNSHSHTH